MDQPNLRNDKGNKSFLVHHWGRLPKIISIQVKDINKNKKKKGEPKERAQKSFLTIFCNTSYTKNGCIRARRPWCSSPCKSHIPPLSLSQFLIAYLYQSGLFFCTWLCIYLSVSSHQHQWSLFEVATKREISPLYMMFHCEDWNCYKVYK